MESFQGISFQGEEWRRIIQIGAPFIWTLDLGPWTLDGLWKGIDSHFR